jgi:hypothetical protein
MQFFLHGLSHIIQGLLDFPLVMQAVRFIEHFVYVIHLFRLLFSLL